MPLLSSHNRVALSVVPEIIADLPASGKQVVQFVCRRAACDAHGESVGRTSAGLRSKTCQGKRSAELSVELSLASYTAFPVSDRDKY